jgi:GAF domain
MASQDDERLRHRVLGEEARRADLEKSVATWAAVIVFLVAMAVLGAFTPDLWKYDRVLTGGAWLVLAIAYAFAYFRTFPSTRSFVTLAVNNEQLEQDVRDLTTSLEALQRSIGLLSFLDSLNFSSRRMATAYIQNTPKTLADFKEMCAELLAPVYLEGEALFGLGGSERWNFAVYLYSKDRDELVPVWREKSANHPSEGMGRAWGSGRGHVGKAFIDGQPIITGDATHPDVAQFCASGEAAREYDSEVYRSFASFPIGPIVNGESKPFGVLVATSDRIERFSKENTVVLSHLAETLAAIVSLAHIDAQMMLRSSSDSRLGGQDASSKESS